MPTRGASRLPLPTDAAPAPRDGPVPLLPPGRRGQRPPPVRLLRGPGGAGLGGRGDAVQPRLPRRRAEDAAPRAVARRRHPPRVAAALPAVVGAWAHP